MGETDIKVEQFYCTSKYIRYRRIVLLDINLSSSCILSMPQMPRWQPASSCTLVSGKNYDTGKKAEVSINMPEHSVHVCASVCMCVCMCWDSANRAVREKERRFYKTRNRPEVHRPHNSQKPVAELTASFLKSKTV